MGSAIERSSFESPKESSSDDSWVLFWSEERIVDLPEDTVLIPVVGRTGATSGEDDASSSMLMTCRSGELCSFFDDPMEMLSVISLRNIAVSVSGDPFIETCFASGDTGNDGPFADLPSITPTAMNILSRVFFKQTLQIITRSQ